MRPVRQPSKQVSRTVRRRLLCAAIVQSLISLSAPAAEIVVNDSADTTGGASCTLRDAIASANGDSAAGGCAAGNGADTITFAAGILPATITLQSGSLTLASEVSLTGPGPDRLTLSGNNASGILALDDGVFGSTTSMAVSGLRLTEASASALSVNAESATLSDLSVVDNASTGISVYRGATTIADSTISGNSASGISSTFTTLSITNSTISDNTSSRDGGGINSYITVLNVDRSTISGNSASDDGGGIYHYKGIAQSDTFTATITNSTISGNSAAARGGGMHNEGRTTNLTHVTIANNSAPNGGGLFNNDTVVLRNSVIADNLGGNDCVSGNYDVFDSLTGSNLVEDGSCTPAMTGDPQLGSLSDNAGSTLTQSPGIDAFGGGANKSVLIDNGSSASCLEVDQRGLPRIDRRCDIGALEVLNQMTVNSSSDEGINNNGVCTFREAIELSNNPSPGITVSADCARGFGSGIVTFDPAINGDTITIGSYLRIVQGIVIDGPGAANLTVSGDNARRVLRVNDGLGSGTLTDVRISGLTIANGRDSVGAGIRSDENLTLDGVILRNNTATASSGGGLSNSFGTATILNSTIHSNSAPSSGGGLNLDDGSMVINSTISGNSAVTGGGISASSGDAVDIFNSTVVGNSGSNGGGLGSGTLTLQNTIVADSNGPDCGPATVNAGNDNIIEDGTCGTSARAVDPALGPLTANGGPTPTHLPDAGSAAIDTGDETTCQMTDQRGVVRADNACDIGAVERSSTTINVSTVADSVADDGLCSLREAFISVNDRVASGAIAGECPPGLDSPTIVFDPAIHGGTVTLTGGALRAEPPSGEQRDFSLVGPEGVGMTIDANTQADLLEFSYVTAGLQHLTLTGASATFSRGGAINSFVSTLTIDRTTIEGNTAQYGAAFNGDYSNTTIINSTVSGNSAAVIAAVADRFGSLTLINSTVANNSAPSVAGVLLGTSGSDSSATFINAIMADNIGGDCLANPASTVVAGTNNLIEDGGCGTVAMMVDPALAPLGDNGGGGRTHAFLPGSPAVDAGDDAACAELATDQTGMPRSIDGDGDLVAVCDLGAFEFVDVFGPEASAAPADVIVAGATEYLVDVAYRDGDSPFDRSTMDVSDIAITGPGGLLSITEIRLRNSFTIKDGDAQYVAMPPGGSWDANDNGEYTVSLNANAVFDEAVPTPNAANATTLGTFQVAVPDIDVLGNAQSISDGDSTPRTGDHTSFANVVVGSQRTRTFTITNIGLGTINLTGDVAVTGAGFSVVLQPADSALAAGESTTFRVRFRPSGETSFSGSVTIPNDDADESPYDFSIGGTGVAMNSAPTVSDASFVTSSQAPAGTRVGVVAATDPDGNIAATGGYAITAGNNGAFAIDDAGQITVVDIDQALAVNTLTITVTDVGGLSGQGTITITVGDDELLVSGFENSDLN